ncbi:hypothetical protein FHR36_004827 [Kitasatospora paracochleata]|uniref:Uncharacterized protein n=1 Tax=Kitasatospora paracochleata TaxID=58354 RepID=A0ABT1J2K5_9ACTN|nr:hypothetical protein [Kitasatospora paracochleata]
MAVQGKNRDLSTLSETIEPAPQTVDEAIAVRARAVVAAHARDGDDQRLLLALLGLAPTAE